MEDVNNRLSTSQQERTPGAGESPASPVPNRTPCDPLDLCRAIFEQTAVGVVLVEAGSGRFIQCNDRFCRMIGYPRPEIEKLGFPNVTHPDDLEEDLLNVRRVLDGRLRGFTREKRYIRKDGSILWANLNVSPLWKPGEPPTFCLTLIEDITERKRTEEALRESNRFLEESQRVARLGWYVLDVTSGQWRSSSLLDQVFGIAGLDYPHDVQGWLGIVHPEDRQDMQSYFQEHVLGERQPFDRQYRIARISDGKERWVHGRGELTLDAANNPIWMVGVIQDITEQRQARLALQEKTEELDRFFEVSQDLLCIGDHQGRFYRVNPQWEKVLGYARADLEGRHLLDFVHPEDCERTAVAFALARQQGLTDFSNRYCCKDGSCRWLEWRSYPAGPLIFASARDITDRRQAEILLQESESRHRNILNHLPMGMHLYELQEDNRLVFLGANPSADRILGVDNSQFIGKTIEEAFPHLAQTEVPERYRQAAGDGVSWHTEQVEYHAGGIHGAYEVHAFRTAPHRMAAVFLDITQRKRAELALRESEEKFRSIAEQITDLIFVTDERGILLYLSPATLKLFGYTPEEMCGHHFSEFLDPAENDGARESYLAVITRNLPTRNMSLRMKRQDGSFFVGELNAVHSQIGNQVGTIGLIRDISDRIRAETEKEKLQSQLLQALKMESVGRLAGGVAHDFNNMLQVILGHLDLAMLEVPATGALRENLEEIQKSAERSADLTRQLLAFARKQTVNPKVLDLNKMVSGMLKMLQRLIGEDVRLRWVPAAIPCPVKMDPSQVDQILANLTVNARDAIDGVGEVTIETAYITVDEAFAQRTPECLPGIYVTLAVTDTGRGIDEETRARLFEPFFTTKALGHGTGLGLATVFGIVKQNNGFIDVQSEPGVGATIRICLPKIEDPVEEDKQPTSEHLLPGTETVMLVEDEAQILELGRQVLEKLGYRVLTARTPESAFALAAQYDGPIQLLITDVVMPGMNGKELHQRLTAHYPGMRCLFISGYTADVIAHHGVLDQGICFLQKPFTTRALAASVRQVLGSSFQAG